MSLQEKYRELTELGKQFNARDVEIKEEEGKLKIKMFTEYPMQKNMIWDKIKTFANWENEITADIRTDKTDIFGVYEVTSGDTLSKIAKDFLGNGNRYMEIFNINKDILNDPNMIKVGQKLKIPNQ